MSVHLERQIDKLKKQILSLGALAEEAVRGAIRAVETRDPALAKQVIDGDNAIDQAEIDVEEDCLHTLALYQPVAFDLRFVVAVLKINNDLERIADLAVNIAEQAAFLAREKPIDFSHFDISTMARLVQSMLKRSLDSLVNIDPELALAVHEDDNGVDDMHRGMYRLVEEGVRANPEQTEQYIHILNVSRQLERIGDHCVNIAGDVVYMARGDITRHGGKQPPAGA
ncbi:MAG: phosphate signaling complex protein PhoU [Planctomycetes bacterium]|nr:phosphate signaling complex protein PhoU [Planctomycetota bacterium]